MPTEDEIGRCLAGSRHVLTLVHLMFDAGMDSVTVSGETEHGVPFAITLTVGSFAQEAQQYGLGLADVFAEDRRTNQSKASEN